MKGKIRRILIAFFAMTFLISGALLLQELQEYRAGEEIYAEAAQIAAGSESKPAPAPGAPETVGESELSAEEADLAQEKTLEIDLAALQAVNNDVIGWIWIPDTGLSYPLVQGEDNDYYLNHAWNGKKVSAGSIFMDFRCAADFTDFNTVIYGHRMNNESMFAFLKHYKADSYWETHPYIYIINSNQTRRYEVFAAYEAPVDSLAYLIGGAEEEDKQSLVDFALNQTVISAGVVPTAGERILTLSTCTGDGYDTRWVVQAVER